MSTGILLQAAAALIGVIVVFLLAARRPRLTVFLFMLLVVIEGNIYFGLSLSVNVLSFRITVFDVSMVVFAVLGLARLGSVAAARGSKRIVLALGVMVVVGCLSWTLFVGVQPAVVQWRIPLLSLACFLWALSAANPWSLAALRGLVVAGFIAACIQWLQIATYGLGTVNVDLVTETGTLYGRSSTSSVGLVMAAAFWVTLLDTRMRGVVRGPMLGLLAVSILFAQHRSVWLAMLVSGTVYVLWWLRQGGHVKLERVTGALAVLLALFLVGNAAIAGFGQIAHSATDEGNLLWRFDSWEGYVSAPRSAAQFLVGAIFGPTPATDGTIFRYSAHSMYVDAFAMTGLVGAILVVLAVFAQLGSTKRSPVNPLPVVSVAVALTWGFSYQLPGWYWLLIGIASARLAADQLETASEPVVAEQKQPPARGPVATSSLR